MSRVKVIQPCLISYGTTYKAWISLRRNQVWEIATVPSDAHPYYSVKRNGVSIGVSEDDFKRIFRDMDALDELEDAVEALKGGGR